MSSSLIKSCGFNVNTSDTLWLVPGTLTVFLLRYGDKLSSDSCLNMAGTTWTRFI